MLITRSAYGDMIERGRRRATMGVSAELIRAQLPPLTFATGRLVISGLLEPCYDVGGDAFDYAVNGDVAHLALFDALGHGAGVGMRAAVLASVALAAYRNARRGDLDLAETYGHVDTVVRAHDRVGLITGIFAELNQVSGLLRVISAGHPGGFVIRDGAVVKTLPTPTALPVSMGDLQAPEVVEEALQPGDHVLLYTDGVTEARTESGEFFGVERLVAFVVRAMADGLSPPETTRRLVHAILEYQNNQLQDDATILLVQWLAEGAL
jgi:serine phosphatase RsbU (regulator of sigma subunit)